MTARPDGTLALDSYRAFLAELKKGGEASDSLAVTRELVLLYRQIGRDRRERER